MLTNWMNGMKINNFHLENSEIAQLKELQQTVSIYINENNYGIFSPDQKFGESYDCSISKSIGDSYLIKLSKFKGITFGGCVINIQPAITGELSLTFQSERNSSKMQSDKAYFLIINVDYSKRIPYGNPNQDESPARLPFVHPKYELEVLSEEQINLNTHYDNILVIGRFISSGNDVMWDKSYIPPCVDLNSFALLKEMSDDISNNINTLQISLYNIIYKVINKNQNSPLAFNIKYLCEKIIYTVAALNFPLRNTLKNKPPIELMQQITNVANHIKLALDFLPEKEKEDISSYFTEWNGISPSKFDELLVAVIDLNYNHLMINDSFELIAEFTEIISELFKKMSELDLIGKRKADKNMVVREIGPKQTKKFRLID